MKKLIVIFCFLAPSVAGFSQNENWLSFETSRNDSLQTETDTVVVKSELNYEAEDGTLTLIQDERLEGIEAFVRAGEESLDGVLIDGFRVMIYFDQDKHKSEQQKAQFISLYEDHKAYVDYVAPNYRVRVGNFRTRLEAEKLKQELLIYFPTAIVVDDKIQLPQLDTPSESNGNSDQGGN